MPRKKATDFCMLCGEMPCLCFSSKEVAKKTLVKRVEKKPTQSDATKPELEKFDPKAAMRAGSKKALKSVQVTRPEPTDSSDKEFTDAVLNLRPILHSDELARYREILSPERRALVWRNRRKEV